MTVSSSLPCSTLSMLPSVCTLFSLEFKVLEKLVPTYVLSPSCPTVLLSFSQEADPISCFNARWNFTPLCSSSCCSSCPKCPSSLPVRFESLLFFSICLNCLLLCEVTPFWDLKPTLLNPCSWNRLKVFLLPPFKAHRIYFYSSTYYRLQGISFYSTRQWLLGCSLSSERTVWSMLGITAVNDWPDPTCNNHLWPCPFVTLKCWSARGKWEYHDLTLPSPLDCHFPPISPTLSKNPFPSQGSFCFIPSRWLWLEGKQCSSLYTLKPQPFLGNTGSIGHQMSAGAGGCLNAVPLLSVPEGCILLFIISLRVLQNALSTTSLTKLLNSSWKQPRIHRVQNSGISNSKYLQ